MVEKKVILQLIGRFFWFVFFAAVIIAGSILTKEFGPNSVVYHDDSFNFEFKPPMGYTEWAGNQTVIFDQHSHTTYSDGVMTVEQNILWHIAHGFNAVVISDHRTFRNKADVDEMREKYKDQVVIIQGLEWSTSRLHMNFLGLSTWDLSIPNEDPTDQEIQDAINKAHELNAIVTINHIPWSLRVGMDNHPSRAQLLAWGVDYVEIVNEFDYDNDSIPWCNNTGGFGMITGTDVHSPENVVGWTGLNVSAFTVDGVMEELRAKRTTIFYNSTGSIDASVSYNNPWYEVVKPLNYIGGMFERYWPDGADWLGIGVFALYLVGVFVLAEVVRVLRPRFWAKMEQCKVKKVDK